ncbi:MAG: RecX family transcriptional regulator [Peptoniphilus sp.]|nr:RecX family transcriptional regulator [Peptoniphilus sp.]
MEIIKIIYNKTKDYTVYFDNGESITLLEDTLIKENISKGNVIDEEKLASILFENRKNQAFETALNYLKKLRTSVEVANHLQDKGFSKDIADHTLKRLRRLNYIDDEKYAAAYCRDKININRYGPQKIAFFLKSKGIDESIINSSLSDLDWDKVIDNLKKDGTNKLNSLKQDDKRWEKTLRYLLGKGYSYDLIKKHL